MEPRGIGLAEATPELVQRFLDEQGVSPATKGMYLVALRRFFDLLVARQAVPSNPAGQVRQPVSERGRHDKPDRRAPPTRDELKGYVRELALAPIEEGDEDFEPALVMLAGLCLGTRKVMPLSRLTGVAPRRVAEFAERLRANGVWTSDGKTACQWFDDDGGHLAFWLDAWVATGMMERCDAPPPAGQDAAEANASA
jgi:hypothetical protein